MATTALLNLGPSINNIPSDGSVQPTATPSPSPTPVQTLTVKVYNNPECTIECTSVAWGTLTPGGTSTKTVYVKNTGTVTASLNMTTSGLTPSGAAGKIWVTWDSEHADIATGAQRTAVLTLHADASITAVTNFNINIVITGTEVA